jgi:hypothetical protein
MSTVHMVSGGFEMFYLQTSTFLESADVRLSVGGGTAYCSSWCCVFLT